MEVTPLSIDMSARIAEIDEKRLRRDRLARPRRELIERDDAGALLSDPMNVRYATGSRNMAVWTMHAPGRHVFAATQDPVVLFEYGSTFHVNEGLETVGEMRSGVSWFYLMRGPRVPEKTSLWATDLSVRSERVMRRSSR